MNGGGGFLPLLTKPWRPGHVVSDLLGCVCIGGTLWGVLYCGVHFEPPGRYVWGGSRTFVDGVPPPGSEVTRREGGAGLR